MSVESVADMLQACTGQRLCNVTYDECVLVLDFERTLVRLAFEHQDNAISYLANDAGSQ